MKKTKPRHNLLIGPALVLVCLVVLVINILIPARSFSAAENRVLSSFPGLSVSGLADGTSQQAMDTWFSDQFAGRDMDFHISYLLRKLFGQREINGVFLGKGTLMAQSDTPDEQKWKGNVDSINKFASQTKLPVNVMIVPNAASIQTEKLPALAPVNSQLDLISSIYDGLESHIQRIDVCDEFQEARNDYIYYRTDHHWTTKGASLAWQLYSDANKLGYSSDDFTAMQVSDSFTGTLAGKTGSVGLDDDISIAVSNSNPEYIVTWADGSKTTSIYNKDALQQRDQYQVFLGANQAVVQIDTTAENQRHLLLLKDSYANSMIQYMLPYYQSITIVDPRYYYEDLSTLINLNNINEVAFLFSCDTFVTDASMQAVLKTAENTEQDSDTGNENENTETEQETPNQE